MGTTGRGREENYFSLLFPNFATLQSSIDLKQQKTKTKTANPCHKENVEIVPGKPYTF